MVTLVIQAYLQCTFIAPQKVAYIFGSRKRYFEITSLALGGYESQTESIL
jgi:hypothetical protein